MTIPRTMGPMGPMVTMGHGGRKQTVWQDAWPVPRPAHDKVLIAIRARGLNDTDVNTRSGWYSKTVTEADDRRGVRGGR